MKWEGKGDVEDGGEGRRMGRGDTFQEDGRRTGWGRRRGVGEG